MVCYLTDKSSIDRLLSWKSSKMRSQTIADCVNSDLFMVICAKNDFWRMLKGKIWVSGDVLTATTANY